VVWVESERGRWWWWWWGEAWGSMRSETSAPPEDAEGNGQFPLFFPRTAELRAVAGFTPCYYIGREKLLLHLAAFI
jgi:hypothetical protein